ncbi:MAG: riboflavin synthase [Hyphomicrobiaceae bacterium]|nr:riboflavin synthase [Hyphomicrobiaceae bacterium]
MFTGIITAVGTVRRVEEAAFGLRFHVESPYDPDGIAIGASICHEGACLTVIEKQRTGSGGVHVVDASRETLDLTTLGAWHEGTQVNLERSLTLGDELGGHLVTGHVDGVAQIVERIDDSGASHFWIEPPAEFERYIARKGSVALCGTSLTVNETRPGAFRITLIPHTLEVTTWGARKAGDRLNLEVDMMARYVDRLRAFD